METFRIDDHIEIVCEWKKTQMAFKHEAALLIDGREVERTKICYQNRTWEQYEFQSVIHKLIEKSKALDKAQKEAIVKYLDGADGYSGAGCKRDMRGFGMIAGIAQLGEFFGKDLKEKNDWKARMLKAGLGSYGLQMPEDWDELNEDTKKARLDAVIDQIQSKKE